MTGVWGEEGQGELVLWPDTLESRGLWDLGCFGAPARRSPGEEGACVQVAAAKLRTDSQCCEGILAPPRALPQGFLEEIRGVITKPEGRDEGFRWAGTDSSGRASPSPSGWGAAVVVVVGV